jgi:hypothetical protein
MANEYELLSEDEKIALATRAVTDTIYDLENKEWYHCDEASEEEIPEDAPKEKCWQASEYLKASFHELAKHLREELE